MNRRNLSPWISILLCAIPAMTTQAELAVHPLFASNMVLQREMADPVWGWSSPGQTVEVRFAGKTYTATANSTGRWQVTLDAAPANATPQTMVIQTVDGSDKQTLTNILIGDVWLCSGQSNMLAATSSFDDAKEQAAHASNPQLRLFRVDTRSAPKPEERFLQGTMGGMLPEEKDGLDASGLLWQQASPESVARFSGVASVFGSDLQRDLHIPIGIVMVAFGGTPAQYWIPRAAMLAHDDLRSILTNFQGYVVDPKYPGGLYNGSVVPLQPLAFKGMAWYQGESNSDTYAQVDQYKTLLPLLIQTWREAWKRDFPVLLVQICGFHDALAFPTDAPLARLREVQEKTVQDLPNVGMITAIDLGLAGNWHPPNKSVLGHRLAIAAQLQMQNPKTGMVGPHVQGVRVDGERAIVTFSGAEKGLTARTVVTNHGNYVVPASPLRGFALSGADGVFHWATATLSGKDVELTSPEVPHPVYVRYGWAAFPLGNLYSSDGLPAFPFRTDTFQPDATK